MPKFTPRIECDIEDYEAPICAVCGSSHVSKVVSMSIWPEIEQGLENSCGGTAQFCTCSKCAKILEDNCERE